MTFCLYVDSPLSDCPSLCCRRTAPEVSEEKGSYASRFCRWFLESFKSFPLLLVALPGLIATFAQLLAWRSLLWLSMMAAKVLDTKCNSSAQHCWPDLWHYIHCFVQSWQAFMVERNKHTHARTHARKHTHKHNCHYDISHYILKTNLIQILASDWFLHL